MHDKDRERLVQQLDTIEANLNTQSLWTNSSCTNDLSVGGMSEKGCGCPVQQLGFIEKGVSEYFSF